MGCKCVDKESENYNEIKKDEQFLIINNNINSKEGKISINKNSEFNQDTSLSNPNLEKIEENIHTNLSENNKNYSDNFKGNFLGNIKSKYILKYIFENLTELKLFKIVKYNKTIQGRLDIDLNDYKKYFEVIVEIFSTNKEEKNIFINYKEEDNILYHIYFNDEKEEKRRNYLSISIEKILII
jgi:hypothetical protein